MIDQKVYRFEVIFEVVGINKRTGLPISLSVPARSDIEALTSVDDVVDLKKPCRVESTEIALDDLLREFK